MISSLICNLVLDNVFRIIKIEIGLDMGGKTSTGYINNLNLIGANDTYVISFANAEAYGEDEVSLTVDVKKTE